MRRIYVIIILALASWGLVIGIGWLIAALFRLVITAA
jgi:hypothetical protein